MRESFLYFSFFKKIFEHRLKPKLQEDPFIKFYLPSLEEAIKKSRKAFIESRSFAFCEGCAKRGIKCCGESLEWKLSLAELILNLLLAERRGEVLYFNTERPEDCLFLGEKGCTLILVPLFCRNFFCEDLSKFLGKERLKKIQEAMEDEAVLSFKLGDYLNRNYLFKKEFLRDSLQNSTV
ncbi:MAG: hypothetical protein NZ530_04745 [Thermodesulfobacteriaceae bacterium]|nr:hypothetical protein [Thermodesulfobacteriaceae bacterium]MCX8042064.1 hypothetical protein [Thermodesulfobacteriaceae bacterium]MDW8136380.1 hypothetical protein [Thermodesulfobacterium sp.]